MHPPRPQSTRRVRKLLAGLLLVANGASGAAATEDPRPDVVLLYADDLGWSDLGCYGSEIATPCLDRLAAEGLRFTRFTTLPRCCPARAALLTGLHPHQAGVGHMVDGRTDFPGYRGELSLATPTIAERLRDAGYATAMVGKWHLTRNIGIWTGAASLRSTENWPTRRGFESFFGMITGAGSYFDPATLARNETPLSVLPSEFYLTDALADEACAVLRRREPADGPLFLYVAFTAPHWPLHANEEDIARQVGRYDEGWDELRERRFERQKRLGIVDPRWALSPRPAGLPAWDTVPDRAWQARRMEVYAAQVEALDRAIGRVLAAVDARGRRDETLVLFLADNGGCAEEIGPGWKGPYLRRRTRDGREVQVGNDPQVLPGSDETYQSYGRSWALLSNTPFRLYKHFAHEGGIATPCLARWPRGIAAPGRNEDRLTHVTDVAATLCDLAGIEATDPSLEGRSLARAFAGVSEGARELGIEHEGNRAWITERYKLVARGARGPWELYDQRADRTETQDLAARHPELVAELGAAWEAWAVRTLVRPWPWK